MVTSNEINIHYAESSIPRMSIGAGIQKTWTVTLSRAKGIGVAKDFPRLPLSEILRYTQNDRRFKFYAMVLTFNL
jgi:hypothetical protein